MQRGQHTNDIKKATVFKWFKRFKDGRSNISDDAHSGRPSTLLEIKLMDWESPSEPCGNFFTNIYT